MAKHSSTWTHSPDMNLFTDASSLIGVLEWSLVTTKMVPCQSPLLNPMESYTHGLHGIANESSSIVTIKPLFISRSPQLMHLVRALFFVTAKHNFHVTITHIYGTDNSLAETQRFLRLAPQADPDPTPIPVRLTFHSPSD